MTTRIMNPERINLAAWSFANDDAQGEAIGRKVSAELRDTLSYDDACDAAFGISVPDNIEAETTDIAVTLPFGLTEDDWEGPVLVISLEEVAKALVDDLDAPDGGSADIEDLVALRDGLTALARQLDEALSRNEAKLEAREQRGAPMW